MFLACCVCCSPAFPNVLCHIFIFIFIFLLIHGACCSWIFHHCNLIILFQNGTPNVEYVAALIWNAWMSLKISAYFPLKVSQWQHWSSWKSPLTQNSISPPPKKKIAIGSRHAWRSPSLPKFPVFSTKKIFFFFNFKNQSMPITQGVPYF